MTNLPPKYWLDQCRAELAAVRAWCCSHGVERGRCREDHDETEADQRESTEEP